MLSIGNEEKTVEAGQQIASFGKIRIIKLNQ
jgi:hypothetical protein